MQGCAVLCARRGVGRENSRKRPGVPGAARPCGAPPPIRRRYRARRCRRCRRPAGCPLPPRRAAGPAQRRQPARPPRPPLSQTAAGARRSHGCGSPRGSRRPSQSTPGTRCRHRGPGSPPLWQQSAQPLVGLWHRWPVRLRERRCLIACEPRAPGFPAPPPCRKAERGGTMDRRPAQRRSRQPLPAGLASTSGMHSSTHIPTPHQTTRHPHRLYLLLNPHLEGSATTAPEL